MPVGHPGRWASTAVVVVLAAMFVHSLVSSTTPRNDQIQRRFQWPVVGQYFLSATCAPSGPRSGWCSSDSTCSPT